MRFFLASYSSLFHLTTFYHYGWRIQILVARYGVTIAGRTRFERARGA